MDERVTTEKPKMTLGLRLVEYLALIAVVVIFGFLVNHYIVSGINTQFEVRDRLGEFGTALVGLWEFEPEVLCGAQEVRIEVEDGALCRGVVNPEDYQYLWLFDQYPQSAEGREIIYSFFDEGSIEVADRYLQNEFPIERFDSVTLTELTWQEDPFGERYWRYVFYSLRELRHLLYAYQETGDERYRIRLLEIVNSFLDTGVTSLYAWDDYHGVAFRTMALTNIWWKLREQNALPVETSEKILASLVEHGDFLIIEDHYEDTYNHSITQLAALLVLSVAFPDLDQSGEWRLVAEERLHTSVAKLVDADGVLVENSPFYHFYTLEKYWEIRDYTRKFDVEVDQAVDEALVAMIGYATYVLQPNQSIPILGASIERVVGRADALKAIAREHPEFDYVLTQGVRGEKPAQLHQYYPTAGQAIFRSDWGKKTKTDNTFVEQTQVIFDVGPYRTNHSDLDALSFTLFGKGKNLITDSGLYTYEYDDVLKPYFHGTRGHNTVVVDGKDQRRGSPVAGVFETGPDWVYHSAQHDLYPDVRHQRALALLGSEVVVIVDHLISDSVHEYEQLFHVYPEATVSTSGLTATVANQAGETELTVRQFLPEGLSLEAVIDDEEAGEGYCSLEYEKLVPCFTLIYSALASTTSMVTVLSLGDSSMVEIDKADDILTITTAERTYQVAYSEVDRDFIQESKVREEVIKELELTLLRNDQNAWILQGEGADEFAIENRDEKVALVPLVSYEDDPYRNRPRYQVTIEGVATYHSINGKIETDIPFAENQELLQINEQEDFIPILGYHHIRPDDYLIEHPTLEMHASKFEEQIKYATQTLGCRWFTFGEIMEDYVIPGIKTPVRACVINFDDGRKNHFTEGYPIFRSYGAVASFYVIAERVLGNNASYMSVFDLEELRNNGNEIGSHTLNASSLTEDGYSDEALDFQLREAKRVLEDEGHQVTTFAYPRGDQDSRVVEATKQHYLAGRDTSKDNRWRDPRPVTTSFDPDYIWHMHYFKPELVSLEEFSQVVGYTGWWQFEEGYQVRRDSGFNNSITTRSSIKPTDTSFASVELGDVGDRIANQFVVREAGQHTIELFLAVGQSAATRFSQNPAIRVLVDGEIASVRSGERSGCRSNLGRYYCSYQVTVDVSAGTHELVVEAKEVSVYLDKFRMYRVVEPRERYQAQLISTQLIEAKANPEQIRLTVTSRKTWSWFELGLVTGVLVLIGYWGVRNRAWIRDHLRNKLAYYSR